MGVHLDQPGSSIPAVLSSDITVQELRPGAEARGLKDAHNFHHRRIQSLRRELLRLPVRTARRQVGSDMGGQSIDDSEPAMSVADQQVAWDCLKIPAD